MKLGVVGKGGTGKTTLAALISTEPSRKSALTAARTRALAEELGIPHHEALERERQRLERCLSELTQPA